MKTIKLLVVVCLVLVAAASVWYFYNEHQEKEFQRNSLKEANEAIRKQLEDVRK